MRLQKSFLKLYKIFFILSIIIIISGIHTYRSSLKFKENAIKTTATVTNVREHFFSTRKRYKPYKISVSYNVNEKKYDGSYTSYYEERTSTIGRIHPMRNDKVTIYYDKTNPKKMSNTIYDDTGIFIIIFGSILCVILLFLITKELKK